LFFLWGFWGLFLGLNGPVFLSMLLGGCLLVLLFLRRRWLGLGRGVGRRVGLGGASILGGCVLGLFWVLGIRIVVG